MALLGTILKNGLKLSKSIQLKPTPAYELQRKELVKLISTAEDTDFGRNYHFYKILNKANSFDKKSVFEEFKANVPIFNYNKIYDAWWHRTLEGQENVAWPGKVKYFALSSGTSEASTKHIPLSKEMLKAIKKSGIRQMLSLSNFNLEKSTFEKRILMLGGSTDLEYNGTYYEGDLSGISASKVPFWFHHFYKPGRKIARNKDWESKLNEIVEIAPTWDVGYIVGVPAWIQILMEKIIQRYNLKNIHEVWPNLQVFVHGGVSFEPYKKGFEKLLGKPLTYIETYLASEGFIAFQTRPNNKGMKMVLNNGIFFEFVPFNDHNFDSNGDLIENPETLLINEVQEGVDYALLITTCAGTWRYLIGDVIRFTDLSNYEIIIKGRTKHFLSLCGEHLSVDNMNKAIKLVSQELNIDIKEFTVAGIPYNSMFAHKWFIGTDAKVEASKIKVLLDEKLKELNDDYRVERIAALQEVFVEVLPCETFYEWMKLKGKQGGQHKFPRVLKSAQLADWEAFLKSK